MSRNTPEVWEMKLEFFSDFRGIGILLAFSALLFYSLQQSAEKKNIINGSPYVTILLF